MDERKYWLIRVDDGLETKFQDVVPVGVMSEDAVERMLGRLVAKNCLSDTEIVSGSVARNSKRHVDYFHVERQQGPYSSTRRLMLTMGAGPTATATVFTESDLRSLGLWKDV